VLHRGIYRTKIAGDLLDLALEKALFTDNKTSIPTRFQYKKEMTSDTGEIRTVKLDVPSTITESYHRFMQLEILRDIKQTVSRVSDKKFDPTANQNIPTINYELPDAKTISVGIERFTIPESLFYMNPAIELKEDFDETFNFQGLHKMVAASVDMCDSDIRKELYLSLIVTGGNTLYPGLPTRLQKEIQKGNPPAFRTKILHPNTKSERRFGVWIGGSILGSLGTFHQMWFSKSEYEEHGATLLSRKCP